MRIVVLSARPDTRSNTRIGEAAAARGLDCELVDATRSTADSDGSVWHGEREIEPGDVDAVLARVGNWRPDSLLALLDVLSGGGAATPNPPAAIRLGRDHWRTARTLTAAGLPFPTTVAGSDPETVAAAARRRLEFPVVVKQRRSRMGVGVIRCDAADHLDAVLDSLWRIGDELVVQRYVETGGRSLRLLVAGSRVVAAASFQSSGDEWRSNTARGGEATALDPSPELQKLALGAARVAGLGLCGVDLLPGAEGAVIGEINPTPGFAGLEYATGADVAGAIVDHLVALAS